MLVKILYGEYLVDILTFVNNFKMDFKMEQCTISGTPLNNPCDSDLSHPGDFTFTKYSFQYFLENSFPSFLCQNTILGSLLALAS